MQFGVIGLILTTLLSGLPTLFLALIWVKKHYGVTVDWVSSAKILFSSGLSAVLTYLIIGQLSYPSWIQLIIGVGVFALTIVPVILFTRTISRTDINSIRAMSSGLGLISKILDIILNILEKVMSALRLP
jgi:hypothetical protein